MRFRLCENTVQFRKTKLHWSYGPLVKRPKTPASHAGNMGSNPVRVTNSLINPKGFIHITQHDIVGVDDGEGSPVPIPNTEVKLTCAENT